MADVYAVASRPGPVEAAMLAELAPTFAVHRRAVGNLTLRYLDGGEGPALCLLHARGHAATSWAPLLARLARRQRVIAIDLPGFGHSSCPPFPGGDAETAVAFFSDAIELLLWELGLSDASLVGHELGGYVAVELALRRMLAPRRLALIGAMGVSDRLAGAARLFFRAPPERLARRLGARLFRSASPLPRTPWGRRLEALEHELCAVPGGRPAAAAAFGALCPLLGPVPNLGSRLGELAPPTLVLWGDRDPVIPAPVALQTAAAIPRATLHVAPHLGHAPQLEDPDAIAPIIETFLADPGSLAT